jgi:hypothetical protein
MASVVSWALVLTALHFRRRVLESLEGLTVVVLQYFRSCLISVRGEEPESAVTVVGSARGFPLVPASTKKRSGAAGVT